MSPLRTINISFSIVACILICIDPAYAATQSPAFFNLGYGATLGKLYTPASPAIDLRNIMDATWNLSDGNVYVEKYLFTPPSPEWHKAYQTVVKHAADHGLVALVGNAFTKNDMIEIEVFNNDITSTHANIINLSGDKLINFSISNTSLVSSGDLRANPAQPTIVNHKSQIPAHTLRKVLDNAINLKGVRQAGYAIKVGHKIILMTITDKLPSR